MTGAGHAAIGAPRRGTLIARVAGAMSESRFSPAASMRNVRWPGNWKHWHAARLAGITNMPDGHLQIFGDASRVFAVPSGDVTMDDTGAFTVLGLQDRTPQYEA